MLKLQRATDFASPPRPDLPHREHGASMPGGISWLTQRGSRRAIDQSLSRMRRLRYSLTALSILACGCESLTEPEGVHIALSVSSVTGPTLADAPDGPTVSCGLDLAAQATGKGTASWMDGTYRIYIGRDTLTAADSGTVRPEEVQASWQAPNIAAGETRHSQWTVTAGIPFAGAIDFRYQPSSGGAVSTTTVRFRCSPPFPPTATPPQLTITSVTPTSGTMSSGGSVAVTYSASSAAGLWQTFVQISGPCEVYQLFSEKLQPTVARTAIMTLPRSCELGIPMHVTVGALDATALTAYRDQPLDVVLVDEQPPVLTGVSFYTGLGGLQSAPLSTYFGGDSIAVIVSASDNHALRFIDWDVMPFGVRDSMLVSGTSAYQTVRIPLRADWSGAIQLRISVRDAAGLSSTAIVTPSNTSFVYPRIARATLTAPYTGNARAVAVDSRRGLIYLALGYEKQVAILSAATLHQVGSVSLPGAPLNMELTPGGDSLLLAVFGLRGLQVIDLRGSTPALSTLPLTAVDSAAGQVVTSARALANGHAMVAIGANQLAGTALLDVDLATGAQRVRTDAAVNGLTGLLYMGRSSDGNVLATNSPDTHCLRRYDVRTDSFSACVAPRSGNLTPALDSTGQRIAISTDVYDAAMNLLPGGIDLTPGSIWPSALSSDGTTLLQLMGNQGLISRDAATGRILGKTPMPFYADLSQLSADGKTLAFVNVYLPGWMIGTFDLH